MTTALRAIAVDDEPLAIERLRIICAGIDEIELVATATDGSEALRLAAALAPDLMLLDIAMPGMSGLELAGKLPLPAPAVVFVTAFDNFAVAAFDVAADDYLLKPIDPLRLKRAVQRAGERLVRPMAETSNWLTEFWVPQRGDIIRLGVHEIDHIAAERDYMRLHSGSRSFLIHETISTLEARLDPQRFLRIHRSTIVRQDCIERLLHDRLRGWRVALRNGTELPVGRSYAAKVRALAGRGSN